jgi:uncharacterized membrane protein YfcA
VVLKRLLPIFYGLVFGVVIGVYLLSSVRVDLLKPIVGVILICIVFLMLFSPRFVVPDAYERYLSPIVGLIGGILGGLAALPGPFVFVDILALGIFKDRFVQYSSMFLVVAATLMTITLGSMGTIRWRDALVSTLAVVPIFVGIKIGAGLRTLGSPPLFRTLILGVVMISGLNLVAGVVGSIGSGMQPAGTTLTLHVGKASAGPNSCGMRTDSATCSLLERH